MCSDDGTNCNAGGGASRRALLKGAAWTVPAIAIAAAAPAIANSAGPAHSRGGLFVQIDGNTNGVGIAHSATTSPQYPSTDYHWDDATRRSGTTLDAANGEGVVTPGGTVGTGSNVSGSGFWMSVPLDGSDKVVPGSSITLVKGATFALDYQIQLRQDATDKRLARPGVGTVDEQSHILENWPKEKGTLTTRTGSAHATDVRREESAVAINYTRTGYWWNRGGYDGAQQYPVMNISVRYTTTQDVTLTAGSGKRYTQLLVSAPSYRVYYPWVTAVAVRIRPISGSVRTTIDGQTTPSALLDLPGIEAVTTSIMGYPGEVVPEGFPNWNISTNGDGGSGSWA